MKRILITGVAGFIGSHLAESLIARGDQVAGLDNFDDNYPRAVKERNLSGSQGQDGFTFYEADILEKEKLLDIFNIERPEVVVHLAAKVGVRSSLEFPGQYHAVNVTGSQHVLDACREYAPSHVVQASSSSVYGASTDVPFSESDPVDKPISPYAATKRMNELMAHVYSHVHGMNLTMLRFFTVYGPRQRPDMAIHKFARLIDDDKPVPMYGSGSTERDYTYVDDVIDGVLRAIDKPFRFEIFNLGESRTTKLVDLIDLISGGLGKTAEIDKQPMQKGDVTITCADISKSREILGYDPRFDLEDGLARFVEWFKTQRNETPASR